MWPHWHYRFFLHSLALDSIGAYYIIIISWMIHQKCTFFTSPGHFTLHEPGFYNLVPNNMNLHTWICTHDEIFVWIGCLSAACVLNISTHSLSGARHKRQQFRFCAITSTPMLFPVVFFFLFFNEFICLLIKIKQIKVIRCFLLHVS